VADLIDGTRLREAVTNQTFIKDGDPNSVENYKYDFRMGEQVLKAAFGQPMLISDIPHDKRFVDPGEAVFVLTQERLDLPADMIATLVPKRKLSHGGILVLGGFAIDPSYRGYILLGLYNFSSTPFPIRAGKKIIAALFYEVSAESNAATAAVPESIEGFPDELIKLIRGYKPVELSSLNEAISSLKLELANLRTEFTTDKAWREDFKNDLQEHNQQIGKLLESLKEEREARVREDEKLDQKLASMSTIFVFWRSGWAIAVAIVLAVVSALLGHYVPTWFD
jgi:dCTP deaminase